MNLMNFDYLFYGLDVEAELSDSVPPQRQFQRSFAVGDGVETLHDLGDLIGLAVAHLQRNALTYNTINHIRN